MQMPKHYEDEELVSLLDTYLQQDPNRKQYFSFLNLIDEDCYKAEYILKWLYDENDFWDSITNNIFIATRFTAINDILVKAKSNSTAQVKAQYIQNFANVFHSYFGADYFIRKHNLTIEDLKGLKGLKSLSAFIKKHEKILGELETKYQETNTENINQINTLIAEQKDIFKSHTDAYSNIRSKNITDFETLMEEQKTTFEKLKALLEAKSNDFETLKINYENLYKEKQNSLENLEKEFNEEIQMKGPAKYFSDESDYYNKVAKDWLNRFYITFGLIIFGLGLSIWSKHPDFSSIEKSLDIFKIMPYITISTLSLLFLIFCGNRYLESKHLHNEMKQKSTLISAYLAIYKDLENNEDTKVLINTKAKLLENIFSVSRYSKKGGMITNDALEIIKAINTK